MGEKNEWERTAIPKLKSPLATRQQWDQQEPTVFHQHGFPCFPSPALQCKHGEEWTLLSMKRVSKTPIARLRRRAAACPSFKDFLASWNDRLGRGMLREIQVGLMSHWYEDRPCKRAAEILTTSSPRGKSRSRPDARAMALMSQNTGNPEKSREAQPKLEPRGTNISIHGVMTFWIHFSFCSHSANSSAHGEPKRKCWAIAGEMWMES